MKPSDVLLVAGYVTAIPLTLQVTRIAWNRDLAKFIALEAGTAAIVAGWALRDNQIGAYSNVGWGVGFVATWVAVGRIRARREAAGEL